MIRLSKVQREEINQHNKGCYALDGVAQWIEHWPVNQRVADSIPSQGTCLGCRPGPPVGGTQEATTH